jgi:hypothetical protein
MPDDNGRRAAIAVPPLWQDHVLRRLSRAREGTPGDDGDRLERAILPLADPEPDQALRYLRLCRDHPEADMRCSSVGGKVQVYVGYDSSSLTVTRDTLKDALDELDEHFGPSG